MNQTKLLLAGFTMIVLIRTIAAAVLPLLHDEGYYFLWSQHLDWGFFDHPPGVAFLASTGKISSHPFFVRLGTLTAGIITIPMLVLFFKEVGITSSNILVATTLIACSFAATVGGILVAPDGLMVLAWIGALWSAARALNKDAKWWLVAGLFTGVGLIGKYVMLMIGPVFLWGLIRGNAKQLRTIWPYFGGIIALLVFSPNLAWNATNGWPAFRFQLQHGLADAHDIKLGLGTDLPLAKKPTESGPEAAIGQAFIDPNAPPKTKKKRTAWQKRIRRYEQLIGGLLSLWGVMLIPLAFALRSYLSKRNSIPPSVRPSHALVVAGTWFPILVFGIAAWNAKVEANWPAVYMVSAAALLTPHLAKLQRTVCVTAALNLVLVLIVALHGSAPFLPIKPRQDRILRDTAGYKDLAQYVVTLNNPVFVDTYQTGSMLRYYQPTITISQWPGVTRMSELVRRPALNPISWQQIRDRQAFWLITNNRIPPKITEFYPTKAERLTYCRGEGLVTMQHNAPTYQSDCPKKQVRKWYLVQYDAAAKEASDAVYE